VREQRRDGYVRFLNDMAEVRPVRQIEDRLLHRGHQAMAEVGGRLCIEDVDIPFETLEPSP
jgi:hypothetical protein